MALNARLTGSWLAAAIGAAGRAVLGGAALAIAVLPVVMLSAAHAAVNEDAVAVIIGNSNYTGDRIPNVDYALRDAEAFKRYLIDIQGYREGNIIDLRDATQAQMVAALGNERTHEGTLWQYIRAGISDVTVYYSGHGVPGLKSKRGYLLPVNADPNKPELNGYPVDTLYANLAKLPARSVTVYLDACFSGDSPKGMLINATSGITITPRLPKQTRNLVVLTTASGAQVASWDIENQHGLFTEHLLAALYGAADAPRYGAADGKVTLGEVEKYLERNMSYAAKRIYGRLQDATVKGNPDTVLAALGKTHPTRPRIALLKDTKPQIASLPPPSLQVEEVDASYVALKTANVRAAPSVKSAKVGSIVRDAGVTVTGKVGKWLRVERPDGETGYVFATLLALADSSEVSAWARVREAKTAKEVAAFLRRYPSGHFADRAKRLKAALSPQVAAITPPKVATPSPATPAVGVYPARRKAGDVFQDCNNCPEMVVIPAGRFRMGDLSGGGAADEKPVHEVRIGYGFAVGKYEVTRAEYAAFANATGRGTGDGCHYFTGGKWEKGGSKSWRDPGYSQTDRDPVACVIWDDAKRYASWLSRKTGQSYRLLSESEWEYAARSGTRTKYSFGDSISAGDANYDRKVGKTKTVGSYRPNEFGLYDMHGNVWEWVEDCWHENYDGSPKDGASWTTGENCRRRVLRGGSWDFRPRNLRAANRYGGNTDLRVDSIGFRVARTLSQ